MHKTRKIVLIVVSGIVAFAIGASLLIGAFWSGALNFMFPNEIATYHSPNGEYSLVFEQMGDPAWPFGPTDIRLTLKNHTGKTIALISTQIHDDGANASEYNVASVDWNEDAVIAILRGSEMDDREIVIPYH